MSSNAPGRNPAHAPSLTENRGYGDAGFPANESILRNTRLQSSNEVKLPRQCQRKNSISRRLHFADINGNETPIGRSVTTPKLGVFICSSDSRKDILERVLPSVLKILD
jgi:hypothetical protein